MKVSEAQAFCLKWNIPFYAYRLPGGKDFFWGAQLKGEVEQFKGMEAIGGQEGFVVTPFRESSRFPSLFIRRDLAFVNQTDDENFEHKLNICRKELGDYPVPAAGVTHKEYHQQVTAMIDALKQKLATKMVLSRPLVIENAGYDAAPGWFIKLAKKYPDAFVFLVSVPGVMTWMGATPEVFLCQTEYAAETMALAGTRPLGDKKPWGEKEKEEQQIVSEYITGLLQENGEWKINGPFTKEAGNVEHLCTTFVHEGKMSAALTDRIRKKLHPTPAVGGFPLPQALDLLEEIEGYDRKYYAGYLGPVCREGFHWFVNLRSMEVFQKAVCLYVGGGITALSDPYREWEETELKARTLLDVIG